MVLKIISVENYMKSEFSQLRKNTSVLIIQMFDGKTSWMCTCVNEDNVSQNHFKIVLSRED